MSHSLLPPLQSRGTYINVYVGPVVHMFRSFNGVLTELVYSKGAGAGGVTRFHNKSDYQSRLRALMSNQHFCYAELMNWGQNLPYRQVQSFKEVEKLLA